MTHPTLLILGALSGAAFSAPLAYAAPQGQETPAVGSSECTCTCPACAAKHGAKAATVGDTPRQETTETPEMKAVREALSAVEEMMSTEERVAQILSVELDEVDTLVLDSTADADLDSGASAQDQTSAAAQAAPDAEDQGYLGVELIEGNDGAEVSGLVPGSPAAASGVQSGDVLVGVAGTAVKDLEAVRSAMQRFKAGDTIGFTVLRDGRELDLSAELADRAGVTGVVPPKPETRVRVLPDVGASAEPQALKAQAPKAQAPKAQAPKAQAPKTLERVGVLERADETSKAPKSEPEPELESELELEEDVEIILAEPIRLPTRAPEPRPEPIEVEALRQQSSAKGGPGAGTERPRARPGTPRARTGDTARKSGAVAGADDALPVGYVEILTHRERRPAASADLQARIEALEAEVAELSEMLADVRRELKRRNLR